MPTISYLKDRRALCVVFGAEIVAGTIFHLLGDYDLIHNISVATQNIIGLNGFLFCALAVRAISAAIGLVDG
ncbi:hypothetical protein [Bartonella sp. LJL80]